MHIINNLEVGGAEKMLVLLLQELSKRDDIELYVVSLEGHGVLINDIPANVIVKSFNYKLFGKLSRFDASIKFKLLNYVKQINPDIIHGHLIKGEDIAKMTGALMNIPVVTTSHDILIRPGMKTKLLNKYVAKAVAVSKVVAKHLGDSYHFPKSKIVIIPNAINTKEFYSGEKKFDINKPVFLYIGRILKLKGIDDAINGIAKLRSDYPRLKFLVYGRAVHDSDIDYLKDFVLKNKYDFVEFMGRTDDVPSALKTGDIFVLPSRSEGFAISVLEAAAAKKPVVATRVGAIPEIVADGLSGILVDCNKPNQIYEACKKILDNNLVEQYGREAQIIATKNFDKSNFAEKYMNLYMQIIK